MDANDNINVFMKHWLFHRDRLEYSDIELEPDFYVTLRDDFF